MAGFRHCKRCDGKGCLCCPDEEKKFIEQAIANAPKWRDGDIRDVRDAWNEAEMVRGFRGLDAMSPDQVEAIFRPALDAEYARQFPNGPQPIFSARLTNPQDMAALRRAFHCDVLARAFEPDGDGIDEVMERVEEARAIQVKAD